MALEHHDPNLFAEDLKHNLEGSIHLSGQMERLQVKFREAP